MHDTTAPPPPGNAPDPAAAAGQVQIRIRDNRDFEQVYKMKTTTKLGKAMDAFAAKCERPRNQLRFLFDGDRVSDEQTVEQMGMENGDCIEVHEEQIGGGE